MNVTRHQAVAQDGHAKLCRSVSKQVDVEAAVVGGEKNVLAVVAPLCDVMRNALRYHARLSRHVLVAATPTEYPECTARS